MRICVIDGQGGGIGSTIIRKLREVFDESIEIIALGTNAIATAQMLKARANRGASGENAIVRTVFQADLVVAPVGIVMAHAMMGEVTPKIAEAVAACPAKKFLAQPRSFFSRLLRKTWKLLDCRPPRSLR
jgi:CBS domain containing-hemolysin-like protein